MYYRIFYQVIFNRLIFVLVKQRARLFFSIVGLLKLVCLIVGDSTDSKEISMENTIAQ
jgi:hypothetical protein